MAPVRRRPAPSPQLRLPSSHYRGFVLEQQADLSWSVAPLGLAAATGAFTTPPSSLADVRALIDWRLGRPS